MSETLPQHEKLGGQVTHSERGQALILIAAAAVALTGMLALVVDTSYLYSQQRKMQTAADAAAMAAAQNWLTSTSQLGVDQAVRDGRTYASLNGFSNNSAAGNQSWDPTPSNGVRVSIPPSTGAYSNSTQYVEVMISKPITTFFAGIFNVNAVNVTARAVARGTNGALTASIIALSTSDDAIKSAGSSTAFVTGNMYSAGGIECGGNITIYSGGAYAVDGFDSHCTTGHQLSAANGLHSGPGIPRIFDPRWSSAESLAPAGPTGNWSSSGKVAAGDGYIHVSPGTYNSISVNPSDRVKFEGGVYHLIGAGDSPALTIQGDVATAAPIQFVLETGAVHFESQASGTLNSGPAYNNILIYSKRQDGGNAIQITGGTDITYNGTIYAPGADVAIAGHTSASVNGQVVARTVTVSGSSTTAIAWDGSKAPVVVAPALAE